MSEQEIYIARDPTNWRDCQRVTLAAFLSSTQADFKWSDSYSFANNIFENKHVNLSVVQTIKQELEMLCAAINKQAEHTLNNLMLCHLGVIGYGVFARNHIPKDSIIGIYAGVINYVPLGFYAYGVGIPVAGNDNEINRALIVDAKAQRNITAFINHLPDENDLQQIIFKNNAQIQDVATANLIMTTVETPSHMPIFVLKANRDIMPGEQLGWSYGDMYWLLNDSPVMRLFSKSTKRLIARSTYNYLYSLHTVQIAGQTYQFKANLNALIKLIDLQQPLVYTSGKEKVTVPTAALKKLVNYYHLKEMQEIIACNKFDALI